MQECEEFAFSFFRNDFLFKCEYYEEDDCWVEKIKEEESEECICQGGYYFYEQYYSYYDHDSCLQYCSELASYNCSNTEEGDYGLAGYSTEDIDKEYDDCVSDVCSCCGAEPV